MTTEEKQPRSHQANRERGGRYGRRAGHRSYWLRLNVEPSEGKWQSRGNMYPLTLSLDYTWGVKVVTREERGGWQNNSIKKEKKME